MEKEDIVTSMGAVGMCLHHAKKHDLQVEIVTFALRAMQQNPLLQISEAIQIGLDEWVK